MYKSDFKEIFWNWQQMGEVIRPLSWHKQFVLWWLSALPLCYIYVLNHEKQYKIRLQRHLFETCNKWTKWQDVSVDIKTFRNNEVLTRINEIPSRINEKPFRNYEVLSRINEKPSRYIEESFRNNEVLSRINEKPSRNDENLFEITRYFLE